MPIDQSVFIYGDATVIGGISYSPSSLVINQISYNGISFVDLFNASLSVGTTFVLQDKSGVCFVLRYDSGSVVVGGSQDVTIPVTVVSSSGSFTTDQAVLVSYSTEITGPTGDTGPTGNTGPTGLSSLAGATDVAFTGLTGFQLLQYQTPADKWVNWTAGIGNPTAEIFFVNLAAPYALTLTTQNVWYQISPTTTLLILNKGCLKSISMPFPPFQRITLSHFPSGST